MKKRIGELLSESGLLSKEQLEIAIEEQKNSKQRLGEIIVRKGWATEYDICNVLSFQLGIPYINLNITPVEPEAIEKVPLKISQKYNVIPYSIDRKSISICMEDPLNLRALDDIRFCSGLDV